MRLLPAATVFLLGALLTIGATSAAEPYSAPTEVQPLLIGTEVPEVDVLTLEGEAVGLRSVVGQGKAVVIFYRGGW